MWLQGAFLVLVAVTVSDACWRVKSSAATSSVIADLPDKVWQFAVDGSNKPYSYLNNKGEVVGFDIDVMNEVCKKVGIRCNVTQRPHTDCGYNRRLYFTPGKALMDEEFDGCLGEGITDDRYETGLNFTSPYFSTRGYFWVKKSQKPYRINSQNIQGKVVVYVSGRYTNSRCLQKARFGRYRTLVAPSLQAATGWIQRGWGNVLLSQQIYVKGLQRAGYVDCSRGHGVMVRDDSLVPDWWNPGFEAIKEDGTYKTLCSDARKKHRRPVRCVP